MNKEKEHVLDADGITLGQSKKSLGKILVEYSFLTKDQLEEALAEQKNRPGTRLGEILIEKEYVSESNLLKALAIQLDLPFYEKLPVDAIDPALVDNLSIQFCRDHSILHIAKD